MSSNEVDAGLSRSPFPIRNLSDTVGSMCYSALVKQHASDLGLHLESRVDYESFLDLFLRRSKGEKLLINKEMESQFTVGAKTMQDKGIGKLIREWHEKQIPLLTEELKKQQERLLNAQESLKKKATKKALNDVRVATNKISKIEFDIERHQIEHVSSESEARIYPLHYFSMVYVNEKNEKVVAPFRYLMRPHDKDADFDFKFNGCYNARLDNIQKVRWWGDSFGKRHGIMIVEKFYENVSREDYLKHYKLKEVPEKESLVLCFEPKNKDYIVIPTLWDRWEKNGEVLMSAALITDDPEPEVAKAGHDRTPIFLKEEKINDWLFCEGKSPEELLEVLSHREHPYYEHKLLTTTA